MGSGRLIVDGRYQHLSGIGRYAREVVSRLPLEFELLRASSKPTAPYDVLLPARRRLGSNDLLYSPGYAAGPSAAVQVVTIHDLLHVTHPRRLRGNLHRLYYERVVRPVVLNAGDVITVSPSSARAIRAWAGESVRIHNCGNAASAGFRPDGPSGESDRPYLLFVGNLKPHKRPGLALAVLALVHDFDLVMVVPDKPSAEVFVGRTGLSPRVRIRSQVTDAELASLYRGAVALLFTSAWEGYGLPVLESIRCGTPVVCDLACESAAEIAANDPASQVLDRGSAAVRWAEAVTAIVTNQTRSDGNATWLHQMSWDAVADKVSAVLVDAMSDRRKM